MALKTSKITSEVLQTCNKMFINNTDFLSRASSQLTAQELSEAAQSFRYKIKNTEKPRSLPPIRFGGDEENIQFAELQPSSNPLFRFDYRQSKWAEESRENNPFPASIKARDNVNGIYSDLQKAEDKLLKSKISVTPLYRNYSTVHVRHYGRAPAENNSEAQCSKKLTKCAQFRKPKQCKLDTKCKKHRLEGCKQSKGSDCKLNYLDPNCTKKYAPYPSYSETCAEVLPDDPSECHQCPWRTCDGADEVELGKPVSGRRHFSTSAALNRNIVQGVVTALPQPPPECIVGQYMCDKKKCGVTKKPCKEPPGPCEVRRQKEEQQQYEKTRRHHEKKKEASDSGHRLVLSGLDSEVPLDQMVNPYTLETMKLDVNLLDRLNESWNLDVKDVYSGMLAEKNNKYPFCQKKRKPKRPKHGPIDFQSLKPDMLADKKKRYDEGHPPPCLETPNKSKNCPKEKLKKPKYKKKPMTESFYKED